MKLIIAGSRTFTNYQKLKQTCDYILQDKTNIEIVSGAHTKGADFLGEKYAAEKGFQLTKFPADWKRYRKAAGPKRNQQMANYADALIAFWDGKSKGTLNMINLAEQNNLKVIIMDV
ncbi:DUF2493 domain-containing protein [Lutibacter sp. HS1-25]|uniref:DUF2493 domain-containing protein n=1 Tax=Lutibacter sp. HS1-25 TaxID=2485000 RepID=UPI0010115B61|nr:DUF2493 domain-containing protein [Lutibacter sp. HS1-25]RXP52466.1 DUF2493 domain-containing protein [Lutibacter sp. HS1-25]